MEKEGGVNSGGYSPLQILNAAREAVPAVNYALGVAGIAAAGAIITLFLGWTRASIVLLALIFVGMVLLFAFSQLAVSRSQSSKMAGEVLLWGVLLFFLTFLIFTVTAFASEWPAPWAAFLGVSPPNDRRQLADACERPNHRVSQEDAKLMEAIIGTWKSSAKLPAGARDMQYTLARSGCVQLQATWGLSYPVFMSGVWYVRDRKLEWTVMQSNVSNWFPNGMHFITPIVSVSKTELQVLDPNNGFLPTTDRRIDTQEPGT